MDRLALDEARVAAIAARRARDRRAARSGRRGARRLPAAQRARRAQGARAARRGRGRLRGAAERDDRRRRAVPEVRQRDRAARLVDRRRTRTPCSRRSRARPSRRPGCPPARCRSSPAAAARSWPSWRRQEGVVDLIIPRGGEGLKKALQRRRDGAGDLRGVRQLPRFVDATRRPRRAPRRSSLNAKVQRPGVCNAAETLLVHDGRRGRVPARACSARCASAGVELRGDDARRGRSTAAGRLLADASEDDWATEFLALDARREGRRLGRGGDRARQPLRLAATPRRS